MGLSILPISAYHICYSEAYSTDVYDYRGGAVILFIYYLFIID